jgi:hypothetical protein
MMAKSRLHRRRSSDSSVAEEALVSRVQRRYRARRMLEARRSAALAIARFYRKKRRPPPSPRIISAEPHKVPWLLELDSQANAAVHSVLRSAQLNFRARQLRRSAVRVIERAYTDWKHHAEQARLALDLDGDGDGPDEDLHSYHAERRDQAARCMQGYLQRRLSGRTRIPEDAAVPSASVSGDADPFTPAQHSLILRAQRAFRSHIASQARKARLLHDATRSASRTVSLSLEHDGARLCALLRRIHHERKLRRAGVSASAAVVNVGLQADS